jgi:hypothetical protein
MVTAARSLSTILPVFSDPKIPLLRNTRRDAQATEGK